MQLDAQKQQQIVTTGQATAVASEQKHQSERDRQAAADQIEEALKATLTNIPSELQAGKDDAPQKEESKANAATTLNATIEPAPLNTFEKMPFDQLLASYDQTANKVAPSLQLSQAFLMTSNMRYGAGQIIQQQNNTASYFFQSDYVGDCARMSESLLQIGKLCANMGCTDRTTNFVLEQKSLMRAQSHEDAEIRRAIEEEIVDGLEYVRTKEKIALAKQRVKRILDEDAADESSEEAERDESADEGQVDGATGSSKKPKKQTSSDQQQVTTEEDSQKAYERHKQTSKRIQCVIRQLRRDAQTYLGLSDRQRKMIPLSQIYHRLNRSKEYKKRRVQKAIRKGTLQTKNQLNDELAAINRKLASKLSKVRDSASSSGVAEEDNASLKQALQKQIQQLKTILGVEKRVKHASNITNATAAEQQQPIALSATQLDARPLTAKSLELQDILFEFCGVGQSQFRRRALCKGQALYDGADKIFGRIKKLPVKSTLFQGFSKDGGNSQQQQQLTQGSNDANKHARSSSNFELVKVIGLEPEKVFKSLDKYIVRVHKMPTFSNCFDSYESFVPGYGGQHLTATALPATQAQTSSAGANTSSYARQDGRSVISLNFNPYDLNTKQKRKIYEGAVKDLAEHRKAQIKTISAQQKEKQEQAALKRAWTNIAKRDIPKAYRAYIKYKADLKGNTKKLSTNCMNEVKKKAVRTQRNAKECVMRAKKLTREMLSFWKRRDKELADMKRKKEKFDKEMKKRQQEEEEALLQKKRLEYLMKQSEIYAHFMANKMGMQKEMRDTRADVQEAENQAKYKRVDVDEANARRRMAKMINEEKKRLKTFDGDMMNNSSMLHESQGEHDEVDEADLDVNRFDLEGPAKQIEQPTILKATLKHYQLRGLRWLDNLYEQGINGILADEMGLGKTIQAISLMAHIAEAKGTWGPFLIVVPVTTLHNWKNELEQFCPSLKVLPYWGNAEERKKLSKFLDPKNLTNPAMQIHVLITSYNLITNNAKDQAKLLKIKWNYMILDEAQAIKNNLSRRWKVLLQFNARNRLLLTGTPIQNSMAELWALLHFIMPKLFDNHEQFQEWFSKDIEASSMDKGELNKHQLKRLHAVLKPFMLRRLKRDVEQEIGPKTEVELTCEMTYRQRILYQRIKNKISTRDLFTLEASKQKMENLMNLVMQFRKVCNHPDLFERQVGRNPLVWKEMAIGVIQNPAYINHPEIRSQCYNPIRLQIPKLIFDECFLVSTNSTQTFTRLIPNEDVAFSQVGIETHLKFFNIFNTAHLHEQFFTDNDHNSCFGILRLLSCSNRWSVSDMAYLMAADEFMRTASLVHYHKQRHTKMAGLFMSEDELDSKELNYHTNHVYLMHDSLDAQIIDFMKFDEGMTMYREKKIISVIDNSVDLVPPLVHYDPIDVKFFAGELSSNQLFIDLKAMFVHPVIAESIQLESAGSGVFSRFALAIKHNPNAKKVLLGEKFKPARFLNLARCSNETTRQNHLRSDMLEEGIYTCGGLTGTNIVDIPKYGRLVTDCAKMRVFSDLINRLYAEKHRCLVFCQMTRMLDILEDFLTWKKMTFFRMDGQTTIQDRRYMVEEYQRNDNVFAFLLSTRAGGLGVNLIAADTVIFYDNDWNPTMDEQATDRAHRIGQTKPVTVYRIITKNTVEEKIVKRAKQKQNVQSTVYGDTFKLKDVVQLVMADGDGEDGDGDMPQASFIKQKRAARQPQGKKSAQKGDMAMQQDEAHHAGGKEDKKKSKKHKKHKKHKKSTKTADGAQAMFDEIDREEGGDGESSSEDEGVTFRMEEFDGGMDTNRQAASGQKKGPGEAGDDDQMMEDY